MMTEQDYQEMETTDNPLPLCYWWWGYDPETGWLDDLAQPWQGEDPQERRAAQWLIFCLALGILALFLGAGMIGLLL